MVGYLHNMRMASILSVITNRLDNTWSTDDSSERRACRAACEALHILQQRDRHKKFFPPVVSCIFPATYNSCALKHLFAFVLLRLTLRTI